MVVIEDKGEIKFFEGGRKLTLREGFKKLEAISVNEPHETKKIIKRLQMKYNKDLVI